VVARVFWEIAMVNYLNNKIYVCNKISKNTLHNVVYFLQLCAFNIPKVSS